jgi:hypothetical protein
MILNPGLLLLVYGACLLILESDNFIIHPDYSATTGQNDIALIKLPRPIAYSPNIAPVCLPYSNEFSPGTDCYIAGWGAQDENHKRGVVSSELMEARVPLLSGEGTGLFEKLQNSLDNCSCSCMLYILKGRKIT